MSKKKLKEIEERINKHFKNELEIMRDILKHLNEDESKELQEFMSSHNCNPIKTIDRIIDKINN